MPAMMRVEPVLPRILGSPPGVLVSGYQPWVEVVLRVRVAVLEWDHREESWIRWAVPSRGGGLDTAGVRAFFPGLRGALVGEPPSELRHEELHIADRGADRLLGELLPSWRPHLHHHSALAMTSGLDEPLGVFRRRCLGAIGALVLRRLEPTSETASEVARLAAGIETRLLEGDEVVVVSARVGIAWYPDGTEPALAPADLMVSGAPRGEP